jgi:hypothetical protein
MLEGLKHLNGLASALSYSSVRHSAALLRLLPNLAAKEL